MIKVILIDDERIIRVGLRRMIEKGCPQVTIAAEAEDGREALSKTLEHRPDVCIVDVRMPRMGGIEYVAKIREMGLDVKVIILSGYAEFSYAQQAISAGCSGYLLKPVKQKTLIQEMERLISEIQEERRRKWRLERRSRESLLYRAIVERDARSLGELEQSQPPLTGVHAVVLSLDRDLMTLDGYSHGDELHTLAACLELLQSDCASLLPDENQTVRLDERSALLLLNPPGRGETDLAELLERARARLLEKLHISATFGIGGYCPDAKFFTAGFFQARQAVEKRFYQGSGVYAFGPDEFSDAQPTVFAEEKRFLSAIQVINVDEARDALQNIFVLLREHCVSRSVCTILFQNLHVRLVSLFKSKCDAEVPPDAPDISYFSRCVNHLDLFSDLCDYLETVFMQWINRDEGKKKVTRSIIRYATRYVEEHYDQPVSLNEVADYLGLSVSYFSTLFHRETGEKFISFLIRYKVDKACELLKGSNLKIYEIGEALGYTDCKYFLKIFRKHTGCTPSEYREGAARKKEGGTSCDSD